MNRAPADERLIFARLSGDLTSAPNREIAELPERHINLGREFQRGRTGLIIRGIRGGVVPVRLLRRPSNAQRGIMEIPCVHPYAPPNYAKVRMIDIRLIQPRGAYGFWLHNTIARTH